MLDIKKWQKFFGTPKQENNKVADQEEREEEHQGKQEECKAEHFN